LEHIVIEKRFWGIVRVFAASGMFLFLQEQWLIQKTNAYLRKKEVFKMSLQDELNVLRASAEGRIPPEAMAVMHRATQDLEKSGLVEKALKVNDSIPDFTLENMNGVLVNSSQLLERGPMVLSFFRGSWWPYCVLELVALEKALPEITALGASLVTISPQRQEFIHKLALAKGLTLEFLCDPGNRVARMFKLVFQLPEDLRNVYRGFHIDLEKFNGDDSWTLPMPARYVIDKSGRIHASDVNADYTVRPEPGDTIKILKSLTTPGGPGWTNIIRKGISALTYSLNVRAI
jgi:peroxiredoxin